MGRLPGATTVANLVEGQAQDGAKAGTNDLERRPGGRWEKNGVLPTTNGDLTIKSCDLTNKNGVLPTTNGDSTDKNGDSTDKNGDLTNKNGDLTNKTGDLTKQVQCDDAKVRISHWKPWSMVVSMYVRLDLSTREQKVAVKKHMVVGQDLGL